MNPSPNVESESRAPLTSCQAIRPTRTVAPIAATPATPWRRRSPRRARRPVKGRRATSAVLRGLTIGSGDSLLLDLLDRLLVILHDCCRDRVEEQLRPVRLALRDPPVH